MSGFVTQWQVASCDISAVEFPELMTAAHSSTKVSKNNLHAWVLDFIYKTLICSPAQFNRTVCMSEVSSEISLNYVQCKEF